MPMHRLRSVALALAGLALAAGAAGCGGEADAAASLLDKIEKDGKITIGIKYDQPGLGLKRPDGSVAGLDVDVATYVAGKLGVAPGDITWVEARSANREPFLQQGVVDLVVASYSITDERRKKVTFAGPYYVAHQDIMVRAGDRKVRRVDDLAGMRLCSVSGSVSAMRVREEQKVDVQIQEAGGWDECITRLTGKQVDAVSSDDTVLAGFAARQPGTMRIVGDKFSDERYGIGMRLGDKATCEAVNKAITEMFASGAAEQMLRRHFGPAGFAFDPAQPAPVGCS